MRVRIMLLGVLVGVAAHAEPPVTTMAVECNWGRLTMESIAAGFDQGAHASDPSGDGHGRGTADEPRAGLANVVSRGNLQATCDLIGGLVTTSSVSSEPLVTSMAVQCNWGTLTMEAIETGFDQGEHASDPSGDGHGPRTADEPRAGLANVVERGDLQATCDLISSLLL